MRKASLLSHAIALIASGKGKKKEKFHPFSSVILIYFISTRILILNSSLIIVSPQFYSISLSLFLLFRSPRSLASTNNGKGYAARSSFCFVENFILGENFIKRIETIHLCMIYIYIYINVKKLRFQFIFKMLTVR